MRLVLPRQPDGGPATTRGARLLTPDGHEVTGVSSVDISVRPDDVVRAVVVLSRVVVEYEDRPAGGALLGGAA